MQGEGKLDGIGAFPQKDSVTVSHAFTASESITGASALVPHPRPLYSSISSTGETMDIDIIEEAQAAGVSPQSVRKPIIALVDDAHPFDLEGYISNYTGNFAFNFRV